MTRIFSDKRFIPLQLGLDGGSDNRNTIHLFRYLWKEKSYVRFSMCKKVNKPQLVNIAKDEGHDMKICRECLLVARQENLI